MRAIPRHSPPARCPSGRRGEAIGREKSGTARARRESRQEAFVRHVGIAESNGQMSQRDRETLEMTNEAQISLVNKGIRICGASQLVQREQPSVWSRAIEGRSTNGLLRPLQVREGGARGLAHK